MNFVKYEGRVLNCLWAEWKRRIINKFNIPLHPDSPSRSHLWQRPISLSNMAIKSTLFMIHEIRGQKIKPSVCWLSSSPVRLPLLMTSLCQNSDRLHRNIIDFIVILQSGHFQLLWHQLGSCKSFALNSLLHAGTVLPSGCPEQSIRTGHGLFVQRQRWITQWPVWKALSPLCK